MKTVATVDLLSLAFVMSPLLVGSAQNAIDSYDPLCNLTNVSGTNAGWPSTIIHPQSALNCSVNRARLLAITQMKVVIILVIFLKFSTSPTSESNIYAKAKSKQIC